jgi:trehalose 6-phosphate phosphatase
MTMLKTTYPPDLSTDSALFLDFDGTLVDIADAPGKVVVPPELPALLDALARRLDGALAIVSGRRVENIGSLLRPFRGAIVGLHGLEYRAAGGEIFRKEPNPALAEARAAIADILSGLDGVTIEDKDQAIAVHYRRAPLEAATCIAAAERVAEKVRGALLLKPGKMLVEIGPPDMNKGAGIGALMRAPVFRSRKPVFIGDDITDEDGFIAVNRLGGVSIRVGGEEETAARFRIEDVAAVTTYLTQFVDVPGTVNAARGASA